MKHIAILIFVLFAGAIPIGGSAQTVSNDPGHSTQFHAQAAGSHISDPGDGNVDAPRYRMRFGPGGEPHFFDNIPPQNDEGFPDEPLSPQVVSPFWDSLFSIGGYANLIDRSFVRAVANDGQDIYLGGSFEFVGSTRVYNVAHYDHVTKTWNAMGNGFGNTVFALAYHNGKLYAGGSFSTVGFNKSNPMHGIVVWDGSTWQDLGGGVNGEVYSIAFIDSSVVIGGYFSQAGGPSGVSCSNVARWDGHTWDNLSAGLNSNVNALLVTGDTIYAGGDFVDNLSGMNRVAQYVDGNWLPVGTGVSGTVITLAQVSGKLWIGGSFSRNGDNSQVLNSIGVWDGNTISPVGTDPNIGCPYGNIYAMYSVGGNLYVGGSFSSVAGVTAHSIAKWSTGSFHALGNGLYGTVGVIGGGPTGGKIVGGVFLDVNGAPAGGVAALESLDAWTLNETTPVTSGGYLETSVNAVAVSDQYVFIGGYFTSIKGIPMQHIAAWDKVNRLWLPLGNGLDQGVRSLLLVGTKLYAGGAFLYAGDTLVNHIAYYDLNTSVWHSMGQGSPRYVEAMTSIGTNIYASTFYGLENQKLRAHLGMWDGSSWTQLPGSINGFINALASVGQTLFAGGSISSIDNQKYSNLASFDGSSWSPVGGGTDDVVLAILPVGSDLFVAGDFLLASTDTVRGVARWDGQRWHSLGTGLSSGASSLANNNSGLYVGGYFSSAGGVLGTTYLANWDGTSWSSVVGGTSGSVYSLGLDADALYVGGSFSHVNSGFLSYRFGILHFGSLGVSANSGSSMAITLQNNPNPFNTSSRIIYTIPTDSKVSIEIYNVLGRKVSTLVNERQTAGDHEVTLDASGMPSGMYACRFTCGSTVEMKWMNVVK